MSAAAWPVPESWGNCLECAIEIQRILGGGEIVHVTPPGAARRLGASKFDSLGDWFEHYVVIKDGRVYDAFTGPSGLPEAEYNQLMEFPYWDFYDFTPFEP